MKFPRSLVVAHQQITDRRSKTKCILFPYEVEPTILTIGETLGTDLFNYEMVGVPDYIDDISLNSQEYCHLCSSISKIVLDKYHKVKNARKELPYPYLLRNTEIENALDSFLSTCSIVNYGSLVIECKSSSSASNEVPFLQWFEQFNYETISETIHDEAYLWKGNVRDLIQATALYRRHRNIYQAMKAWTDWKCASPTLLSLLDTAVCEHYNDVDILQKRLEPFSRYFYLITLPNGQTNSQQCITQLPMHIGQYRFSPLPLTVDLISVVDHRHTLMSLPHSSIYNHFEVCSARYYRSLSSSVLCGTDDNLLEKYLDLAEDVIDNKTSFEHDNAVIEQKQLLYNFSASLSGKEEAASEILRAMLHRTDFFAKSKIYGAAKSNDTFNADKSKVSIEDPKQVAHLSKNSRKQMKYARLLKQSEEYTEEMSKPPEDVVCVQSRRQQSSSSSGLIAYRSIERTKTGRTYRAQPLRIQDQFKSYPVNATDSDTDATSDSVAEEWGVGSYNGFTRVPRRETDSRRQICYRHPGWRKVPRIVVRQPDTTKSSNKSGGKVVLGLEGLNLNADNGIVENGKDESAAVVSANNSITDGDISSISEDHNRNNHYEDRIKPEPTDVHDPFDEDEDIDADDISYQEGAVAVVEDDSGVDEGEPKRHRTMADTLLLTPVDFDFFRQFEHKDEIKEIQFRSYVDEPFSIDATTVEEKTDFSNFVLKFTGRKAETKSLQKICCELIDLHRSELQFSKRILDATSQQYKEESDFDDDMSDEEASRELKAVRKTMKDANPFSLSSILQSRVGDEVPKRGGNKTIRVKTFEELCKRDPTAMSIESIVDVLNETFSSDILDKEWDNIALYRRIACQRWHIQKAQEYLYHFGNVVMKIPEQRKQWRQYVGLRTDFAELPDRSRQALAFYRRTKQERTPAAIVKRKRNSSRL